MSQAFAFATFGLILTTAISLGTNAPGIQGEYLEARSASVYIGACHYGAEFMGGGKEATLVWHVNQGMWKGISLKNLTVVAVLSAKRNLAVDTQTRQTVLYIDNNATPEQHLALTDLILTKRGAVIGNITTTRVVPITFARNGVLREVHVGSVLDLVATRHPCQQCTQPHQIWYEPLEELNGIVVGQSTIYRYKDTILSTTWSQGTPTNNVFFGNYRM